jgi:hypothetical protein
VANFTLIEIGDKGIGLTNFVVPNVTARARLILGHIPKKPVLFVIKSTCPRIAYKPKFLSIALASACITGIKLVLFVPRYW